MVYLYLGRDINLIVNAAVAILEVIKLPKTEGVAYLEGRLKSNKYGNHVQCTITHNHVRVVTEGPVLTQLQTVQTVSKYNKM